MDTIEFVDKAMGAVPQVRAVGITDLILSSKRVLVRDMRYYDTADMLTILRLGYFTRAESLARLAYTMLREQLPTESYQYRISVRSPGNYEIDADEALYNVTTPELKPQEFTTLCGNTQNTIYDVAHRAVCGVQDDGNALSTRTFIVPIRQCRASTPTSPLTHVLTLLLKEFCKTYRIRLAEYYTRTFEGLVSGKSVGRSLTDAYHKLVDGVGYRSYTAAVLDIETTEDEGDTTDNEPEYESDDEDEEEYYDDERV